VGPHPFSISGKGRGRARASSDFPGTMKRLRSPTLLLLVVLVAACSREVRLEPESLPQHDLAAPGVARSC